MQRTIRITGTGEIDVRPDRTQLLLSLSGLEKTYEEALAKSANDTEILKKCFETVGFQRHELKTVSFSAGAEYESYRDENDDLQKELVGYKYVHTIQVEFDLDNKILNKILYALSQSTIEPEFRIFYTLKDKEAAKNELLAKAVADSGKKAAVLSETAGVSLGQVVTIDYSWGEVNVRHGVTSDMKVPDFLRKSPTPSFELDMEPKDIHLSDTVTVVWEIV
ncbi:MAG: SIMPL domain-containing protein [Bacteroides fragilis]|nr:SIMPL domain-containing protein [Bacteroides fragilis]